MVAFGMGTKDASISGCQEPTWTFGQRKSAATDRDKLEQQQLAKMGWHSITIWECELKPEKRDKTLESLAFTLNHIFLQDQSARYKLREEEDETSLAAEPNGLK